jgi:hypothetical protein
MIDPEFLLICHHPKYININYNFQECIGKSLLERVFHYLSRMFSLRNGWMRLVSPIQGGLQRNVSLIGQQTLFTIPKAPTENPLQRSALLGVTPLLTQVRGRRFGKMPVGFRKFAVGSISFVIEPNPPKLMESITSISNLKRWAR